MNFKKGILFSFALVFLVIVVLLLAIIIFYNSIYSEERFSELAGLDRVYDLDSSLQKSFRDIFQEAQIIVNVTNSSVSFEEYLPNSGTSFSASMNNFKNFVEAENSAIKLDIATVKSELPLVILPNNVTYKHINFSDNIIRLIPGINFDGYSITAVIDENITSCDWYIEDGSLRLVVSVEDEYGRSCSDDLMVDPYKDNEINVNEGYFTIYTDGGFLDIISNESVAFVKTKVLITGTENIRVEYPDVVVNIDFEELKIAKRGRVRIK